MIHGYIDILQQQVKIAYMHGKNNAYIIIRFYSIGVCE